MSWRENLEVALPRIRNPDTHDAQQPIAEAPGAEIAGSVDRPSEEEESKRLESLAKACRGLAITPAEIRAALAPEDIEDWRQGLLPEAGLAAVALLLVRQREREQGKRPDSYTERATCQHCGPIWLWHATTVFGCPWCCNRGTGKPIPRPCNVRCGDCVHFNRDATHPHLGRCAAEQPEASVGNWDTDQRYCERFLPAASGGRNSA